VAAERALCLTITGSQMNFSKVLHIPICELTSTPYVFPSSPPTACFYLNLFNTIIESRPALSAIVLGITSKAFANAFMTN